MDPTNEKISISNYENQINVIGINESFLYKTKGIKDLSLQN